LFNARVIGLLGAVAGYGFLYRTISSSITNDMQLSCVFVKKTPQHDQKQKVDDKIKMGQQTRKR